VIPSTENRQFAQSGSEDEVAFGISSKDTAHIMGILRDSLYTDRIGAVVREYSANAWDAMREACRGDQPIHVHLPTADEQYFSVRDFGKGLSHEDVWEVFTQYGASTKRGDNTAVGMLGIGSKSAFAYADSFTITSWHNGVKRVYQAVLNNDIGSVLKMAEEPSDEPSGVEIHVEVGYDDINRFYDRAASLYRYFDPKPQFSGCVPRFSDNDHGTKLSSGIVTSFDSNTYETFTCVMGCIPYRLDADKLDLDYKTREALFIRGTLFVTVGEVDIAANREELKYTKRTQTALKEKIFALQDEFVQHAVEEIEKAPTGWGRRMAAAKYKNMKFTDLISKTYLKDVQILDDCSSLTVRRKTYPSFFKADPGFSIVRYTSRDRRAPEYHPAAIFHVRSGVKVYILDSDKSMKGYTSLHDSQNVYVVARVSEDKKSKIDQVDFDSTLKQLEEYFKSVQLDGIEVGKVSMLEWNAWWKRESSERPKIKAPRGDVLLCSDLKAVCRTAGKGNSNGARSVLWEAPQDGDEPVATDPYVVLDRFAINHPKVAELLQHYLEVIEHEGRTLPPRLWGYKTTGDKPFDAAKAVGTPLQPWLTGCANRLMDENKTDYNVFRQTIVATGSSRSRSMYQQREDTRRAAKDMKRMFKAFGKAHLLSKLFIQRAVALNEVRKLRRNAKKWAFLSSLHDFVLTTKQVAGEKTNEEIVLDSFLENVPAKYHDYLKKESISTISGLTPYSDDDFARYVYVIKMIDQMEKLTEENAMLLGLLSNDGEESA